MLLVLVRLTQKSMNRNNGFGHVYCQRLPKPYSPIF